MCFSNFILIKGVCGEQTPTSGLYLDDIGFTYEILNKVYSQPYKSAQDLGTDKINRAIKQVSNDILTAIQPKLKAKTIIEGGRLGFSQDNLNQIAGSKEKGIEIEICNTDDYLDFYLSQLSLQVNVSQVVPVFVYDLITGALLDTINVTTVANERTTVYPNKTYKSDNRRLLIAIVYDSNGISSNNTKLSEKACAGCGSGKSYWPYGMLRSQAIEIDTADTKIASNTDGISDTGGMSIMYSVNCNQQDWLCEKAGVLGEAVLIRTGINLVDYILDDSERENKHTLIDRDSLLKKRDKLEVEYGKWLENSLTNMDLPRGRCFDCEKQVQYKFISP